MGKGEINLFKAIGDIEILVSRCGRVYKFNNKTRAKMLVRARNRKGKLMVRIANELHRVDRIVVSVYGDSNNRRYKIGDYIIHKDGDASNCRQENLLVMSPKEHNAYMGRHQAEYSKANRRMYRYHNRDGTIEDFPTVSALANAKHMSVSSVAYAVKKGHAYSGNLIEAVPRIRKKEEGNYGKE